jgi:leader peptidase (prepilin peptidase)/N-methyltransferase
VGLLLALILPHLTLLEAAGGALVGAGLFYGIAWVYEKMTGKAGLGGGDVKLMAMIGAFLGIQAVPVVIFISAALGSVTGLAWTILRGRWRQGQWRTAAIPYGPFLAAAAVIYLFAGEDLWRLAGG